jgi:purine-nucleoside phosphorylase
MINLVKETFDFIKAEIGDFQPQFGVILGTGLGKLVDDIDIKFTFNYDTLPNFVSSTIESHSGKLLFGFLSGKPIMCMQGRFHFYEGYTMQQVTFPVRVMKMLGVESLIISNASGGLNPAYAESDIMLINDHISLFLPSNPLLGQNIMGDRFPDMSQPYDQEMLIKAQKIISDNNLTNTQQGVYVSVTGPQLETKAEYKLLRNFGADAVGMSTVPEVIVARQMGLKVFGLSVITDMCVPETLKVADINTIIAAAMKAEPKMTFIIKEIIKD